MVWNSLGGQVGFGCGYGDWGLIYRLWGGDE